jgi:hypothetical protein
MAEKDDWFGGMGKFSAGMGNFPSFGNFRCHIFNCTICSPLDISFLSRAPLHFATPCSSPSVFSLALCSL